MNLFKTILTTILIFTLYSCFAQHTPVRVDISRETIKVKGENFYLHKVERNQTLYSISKTYDVEISTIVKDNPSLESGLKEGSVIYIRQKENYIKEEKQVVKLEIKDTLKSRAQDITKPEEQERATRDGVRTTHTVKWYESLSSISRRYGLRDEEIILFNSLPSDRVATRQVLLIPFPSKESGKILAEKTDTTSVKKETPPYDYQVKEEKSETSRERRRGSIFSRTADNTYVASLILPMGGETEIKNETSVNFIEFYQGFLIALEDIKRENPGSNLEIRVFDSDQYSSQASLISSGELEGSNIIIGPVFKTQIEEIISYASEREIPVISPVDPASETLAQEYSNLFHASTPVEFQQSGILSGISRFSHTAVIFEKGGSDGFLITTTEGVLKRAGISYNTLGYTILEGRSILPGITNLLKQGELNHVIVASNSEAFVSDVLRNLNLLRSRSGFTIQIYGTTRWRNFDNVDINHFHSMNLNISMQYYVDYSRDNVKRFTGRFRALYGSEPTPYAFQAYDIASYFLSALIRFGDDFHYDITGYRKELLQNDFYFIRRRGENGFVNSGIRQIIYKPDFSVDVKALSR
ncbi:MAG: LysM peptidoglycan-binding domain-containing protein [Bacteroidales bacterium]|jgi:LysM repeat protein|nr:LysM peptidoglycan-binding domain-containing protein [Bacteroidales bacterium]